MARQGLTRRQFLGAAGAAAAAAALPVRSILGEAASATRPAGGGLNFVWITCEDISPTLGCYGDKHASTPNLDRLAAEGAMFTSAFAAAPVCAPSRCGMATGMYPCTLGAQHMRSMLAQPQDVFTRYLREAGYYVSWGGGGGTGQNKQDFNFKATDGSFDKAVSWPGQAPQAPFFAYTNCFGTHEGQIRGAPADAGKAAEMQVPPYLPDVPEVRNSMAKYYEKVSAIDDQVGGIIKGLERQKLLDSTVIFFIGDHGWGLPRGKRWLYDSGIRVPLIIRWPEGIKPGTVRDDLVSLIDLPATVLSLAGVKCPPRKVPSLQALKSPAPKIEWIEKEMAGQPILGPQAVRRQYYFGIRDRMDETHDRMRCVRTAQHKYIRNFHPELPYSQPIAYMDNAPAMKAWRKLAAEDKLTGPQALFFAKEKPPEELYDVTADPHEINNLAGSPQHKDVLARLRGVMDDWLADVNDLGEFRKERLIELGVLQRGA